MAILVLTGIERNELRSNNVLQEKHFNPKVCRPTAEFVNWISAFAEMTVTPLYAFHTKQTRNHENNQVTTEQDKPIFLPISWPITLQNAGHDVRTYPIKFTKTAFAPTATEFAYLHGYCRVIL